MTKRKLLGALIAGGAASRFGTDKGAALHQGTALIDHIAIALRPQVDELIIVGRAWADKYGQALNALPDRPQSGLGPLGGLNAALHYARMRGFDAVLTAGCDTLPVPDSLANILAPAPATIADHYLFGLWPASLAEKLDAYLTQTSDRSMRGWIKQSQARAVKTDLIFHNINRPEDLAALAARDKPTA